QVAVFTRLNDCPAGSADGVGDEDVVERHPLLCQTVEIGRLVDLRTVGPDRMRGVIVAEYEDDVRTLACLRGGGGGAPGAGGHQQCQDRGSERTPESER